MPFRARVVASAAVATAGFSFTGGTNHPVSASLMLKLVNRAMKLR